MPPTDTLSHMSLICGVSEAGSVIADLLPRNTINEIEFEIAVYTITRAGDAETDLPPLSWDHPPHRRLSTAEQLIDCGFLHTDAC